MLHSGALSTENPIERRLKGLKTNPDDDVDVPGVDLSREASDGTKVEQSADGAWLPSSTAGVLKPAVIMSGESIPNSMKLAVETAADEAERILVLGSSLATCSARRLIKRAQEQGKRIGVANLGGLRGKGSSLLRCL
ncbi:hypothetical protein LTS02_013249 [Friedmanniomyces endolithicus]|nr:hypothetical protein LTS02_013249 [Friedmanniomyces endolithicus]